MHAELDAVNAQLAALEFDEPAVARMVKQFPQLLCKSFGTDVLALFGRVRDSRRAKYQVGSLTEVAMP